MAEPPLFPVVNQEPEPSCIDLMIVGTYAGMITLLALGIIFGALLVVTQHYDLNWGPFAETMKNVITAMGDYLAVPLEISLGAFIPLLVLGIAVKCSAKPPPEPQNPVAGGTSSMFNTPYPTDSILK